MFDKFLHRCKKVIFHDGVTFLNRQLKETWDAQTLSENNEPQFDLRNGFGFARFVFSNVDAQNSKREQY